jgi:DNA processing protein
VKGHLTDNQHRVACVGTREPTNFGSEVARRLSGFLASNGWEIVSGLALGVDTLSHEAALAAQAVTIAVVANGLDTIYPKKNSDLAQRILDTGGALVSEQPFGADATGPALIQRDRIQSGLSVATFVMQTDIKGGTMHTVRYTLMQGRRVYVPQVPINYQQEDKSQGVVALASYTGPDLAAVLQAEGSYRKLLNEKYAKSKAARVIRGQVDYPAILQELEQLAAAPFTNQDGQRIQGKFQLF